MEIKTINGKDYELSNDEIKSNDFIYNIHTGSVDYCVYASTDGDLVVQFDGSRAVLNKKHYKKAKLLSTKK